MQFGNEYITLAHDEVVDLQKLDFIAFCHVSPRMSNRHYGLTSSIGLASLVVYMTHSFSIL
jgi:hypothetical protein